MSIRLSLRGSVRQPGTKSPSKFLQKIAKWFVEHPEFFVEGEEPAPQEIDRNTAALEVPLHAAAEPIDLRFDGSHLEASANTSSAGPGYHQYVCDVLDGLAIAFNITWDAESLESGDETEYFRTRNREELEQHMLAWFTTLAALSTKDKERRPPICLSMSLDPVFTTPCEVMTARGPRSRAWLKSAAQNLEVAREFFAWWNTELDAATLVNWAEVHMWNNVRWAPLESRSDAITLLRTNELLEAAYRLDPTAAIPWRNWHELLQTDAHLEEPAAPEMRPLVAQMADTAQDAPIGYRRDPVRRNLAGWTITHPGEFYEYTDGDSFVVARGGRFMRFSFSTFEGGLDHHLDELAASLLDRGGRNLIRVNELAQGGGVTGVAAEFDSEEVAEPGFYLQGLKMKPKCRVIVTLGYSDDAGRTWARQAWASIR